MSLDTQLLPPVEDIAIGPDWVPAAGAAAGATAPAGAAAATCCTGAAACATEAVFSALASGRASGLCWDSAAKSTAGTDAGAAAGVDAGVLPRRLARLITAPASARTAKVITHTGRRDPGADETFSSSTWLGDSDLSIQQTPFIG